MSALVIVALVAMFVVACAAIGYACFVAGYGAGWQERHADMILPERTMRRLDDATRWRT